MVEPITHWPRHTDEKYHVHVYHVKALTEITVLAASKEEACGDALKKVGAKAGKKTKPDCRMIALACGLVTTDGERGE